ncbi:MAG: hypothetical protein JSS82_12675 [Bacteroidetes bacterium]|nr:hypothetical protein [Bacteroidota bacterium]
MEQVIRAIQNPHIAKKCFPTADCFFRRWNVSEMKRIIAEECSNCCTKVFCIRMTRNIDAAHPSPIVFNIENKKFIDQAELLKYMESMFTESPEASHRRVVFYAIADHTKMDVIDQIHNSCKKFRCGTQKLSHAIKTAWENQVSFRIESSLFDENSEFYMADVVSVVSEMKDLKNHLLTVHRTYVEDNANDDLSVDMEITDE